MHHFYNGLQPKNQTKSAKIRLTLYIAAFSMISLLSLGTSKVVAQCGFCPDIFPGIPIIDASIEMGIVAALFAMLAFLFKNRPNKIIIVEGIIVFFIGIIIVALITPIYMRTSLGGPVDLYCGNPCNTVKIGRQDLWLLPKLSEGLDAAKVKGDNNCCASQLLTYSKN